MNSTSPICLICFHGGEAARPIRYVITMRPTRDAILLPTNAEQLFPVAVASTRPLLYTDYHVADRPQHFSRSCDRCKLSLPRSHTITNRPVLSSSGRSPPLAHNHPGAHRQHSDEAHGQERLTRLGRRRQRYWEWHTRRCYIVT
jgi:hypothetical protein